MFKVGFNRCLAFVFLCLISYSSFGQSYQLHTVYIYSFIRYVQWPHAEGEFTIGVLGESPIIDHLEKMAAAKKAGARNIKIKKFNTLSEVSSTDILFVSQTNKEPLKSLTNLTAQNNTLLITEKEGLGMAGSSINFIERNGKLAFELNKSSIEKAGLKVSTELARLAIII